MLIHRSLDRNQLFNCPYDCTDFTNPCQLSKLYHPDISPNDGEAAQKFLEISEAYNVLGNDFTRRDYDRRTDPSPSRTSSPAGFRRHTSTHACARAANNVADAVHARQAAYDRLRKDREHPAGPSGYWPGRTSASYGHGYGPLHSQRPSYRATNPPHSHPATSTTAPSSAAGATKAKPEELRTFQTGWNPEPHKYSSDREYAVSKERRLLWAIIGLGAITQGVWLLRLLSGH